MQLSIVSVLALAAVALSNPLSSRDMKMLKVRQAGRPSNPSAITSGPPVSAPAMTREDGSIVDFNTNGVYLAAQAEGL